MSPRLRRLVAAVAAIAVAAVCLASCSPAKATTLTFRLWDPQVADAYRESFRLFEEETGISVETVVVPWGDYAGQLRAYLASGSADDVFWANATSVAELARADRILPVAADQLSAQGSDWVPSVVAQYTLDEQVWGVPQLTDPGIAIIVNEELLEAEGLAVADLERLAWDPGASDDSLRAVARTLTLDVNGRHPGDAGFDAERIVQYGYGAAFDLNGILLPFLASNGAAWQEGDEFVFASEAGTEALGYVVGLINAHVSPNAADTNPPPGGDFIRDQFLQGKVALFQTGAYKLSNVEELAPFEWTIVPLLMGPAGRISVTNGVVAAANAASTQPVAQRKLLEWLGSTSGARKIGESGATMPAVLSAQGLYLEYWADHGVNLAPMLDVLENGAIQPPQGDQYQASADAMQPTTRCFLDARRSTRASKLRKTSRTRRCEVGSLVPTRWGRPWDTECRRHRSGSATEFA